MFLFLTKDQAQKHYLSVSDSILKCLEWMLAENTPQRKNRTSRTKTEHNLNTEKFKEPVIQEEEEDIFSLTSQIAPCTVCAICHPPYIAIPQRILHVLSFWNPSKTVPLWLSVRALQPCLATQCCWKQCKPLQLQWPTEVQSFHYHKWDKARRMNCCFYFFWN